METVHLRPIEVGPSKNTNVGSVVPMDATPVVGTVLDPQFQEHGGHISFSQCPVTDNWGRLVSGLMVPPIRATYEMGQTIAILHPLAARANTTARVLAAVVAGTQDIFALQKSVKRFNVELCKSLFGKSGVYNRCILGPRMKNSFRAVAIPGIYDRDIFGESFEWVGIPEKICRQLGISEGDKVLIGRDPTIWSGSLEVLRAYPVTHDAMELHPLLLPQLAADFDGDQLWGYYPSNQDHIDTAQLASFTQQYAVWGKNFNAHASTNEVQWSDFLSDQEERCTTTGLSVGPQDILEDSESLGEVLEYCSKGKRSRGKKSHTELQEACHQVPVTKWLDMVRTINLANLAMKVYMGPMGLLSLRLLVLGHSNKSISEACNLAAERCSQSLLDAKHLSFAQIKTYKPADVFEVLDLRDDTISSPEDMFERMRDITNCDRRIMPLINYLFEDQRGLSKLFKEEFPLFEGITFSAERSKNGYLPDFVLEGTSSLSDEGIFSFAFDNALEPSAPEEVAQYV